MRKPLLRMRQTNGSRDRRRAAAVKRCVGVRLRSSHEREGAARTVKAGNSLDGAGASIDAVVTARLA